MVRSALYEAAHSMLTLQFKALGDGDRQTPRSGTCDRGIGQEAGNRPASHVVNGTDFRFGKEEAATA